MKTTTFTRRFAAAALIVSAGALGFATEAQAKPVKQIDAYNNCMKSLRPREGSTAAQFDCCVVAGGTWTGGNYPDGWCVLKNAPVPDTGSSTLAPSREIDPSRQRCSPTGARTSPVGPLFGWFGMPPPLSMPYTVRIVGVMSGNYQRFGGFLGLVLRPHCPRRWQRADPTVQVRPK